MVVLIASLQDRSYNKQVLCGLAIYPSLRQPCSYVALAITEEWKRHTSFSQAEFMISSTYHPRNSQSSFLFSTLQFFDKIFKARV